MAWDEPRRGGLYTFSLNNPLRFVAPDGRDGEDGSFDLDLDSATDEGIESNCGDQDYSCEMKDFSRRHSSEHVWSEAIVDMGRVAGEAGEVGKKVGKEALEFVPVVGTAMCLAEGDYVCAGLSLGGPGLKGVGKVLNKIPVVRRLAAKADGELVTVFRGVQPGHPGFANAQKGVAKPRRRVFGHSDPARHNAGNTKSKFVSVTTDRNVARRFSGRNGVVIESQVPRSSLIDSPDLFNEAEKLIRGVFRGTPNSP